MVNTTFGTWAELATWLENLADSHFQSHRSDKDHDAVRFGRKRTDGELGVFVIHNKRETLGDWVFVGVRIAPVGAFDLGELLSNTRVGPVGALSLAADYLCASHNMPLASREGDMLDVIDALCDLAARCKALATPADAAAAFAHLAD